MEDTSIPVSTVLWFVVPPVLILAASFLLTRKRGGEE
jgi:hypothetical protein